MCEFKVFLNGEKVFDDAVHVKFEGNNVILRNILGETKKLTSCIITEIHVPSEKVILTLT